MSDKINVVYKLYFSDNPNKVYIGSAKNFNKRLSEHLRSLLNSEHSNYLLQLDFKKYGLSNFKWEIIESNIPSYALLKKESEYINTLKSAIDGYNITNHATNPRDIYIPDNKSNPDLNLSNDVYCLLKNNKIKIEKIDAGEFKEGKKYSNFSFSKNKIDSLKTVDLKKIINNIVTYMRFHIHDTNRSIIAITPYNTSKSFRTFVDLCGSDLSISAPIKRFNDCHSTIPVKHVVVCVSANSYFIEMSKMNADEKDFHRMNYILKHIANFEFSETLTIHVPPLYYDSYINGLKLVTESYNNVKYKLQS